MGFLSKILKVAAPVAASFVPGIGPLTAKAASSLVEGGINAFADSRDDRDTRTSANNAYNQQFNQQLQLGEVTNAQRVAAAQKQMDFQREMSNTSHQREIDDLAAAGLNPILSSRYGGSSTPGGAMAQIADTVSPAASSALARRTQDTQLRTMSAQLNESLERQKQIKATESLTRAQK